MEAMSVTLVGDPHEDRLGELNPCLALGEGDRNGVLISSSRPSELLKLLLRVDMDLRGSNLFASGSSMPCCVLVLSRRESFQFVLSLNGSAIEFLEFCFFILFLESCLGKLIPICFSFCKESQIDLAAPPPIPVPIPASATSSHGSGCKEQEVLLPKLVREGFCAPLESLLAPMPVPLDPCLTGADFSPSLGCSEVQRGPPHPALSCSFVLSLSLTSPPLESSRLRRPFCESCFRSPPLLESCFLSSPPPLEPCLPRTSLFELCLWSPSDLES